VPPRDLSLFLSGDVMLGRGIDQILAHPGDPRLHEEYVRDARGYVRLAEDRNGPVHRPVAPSWPWGDALPLLAEAAPDVRVVNLETSVTRSDDFAPGKAVHYRMHPDNLAALTVARPDVCVLANNHVMDFGARGLHETLDVLEAAGLRTVGAGRDEESAWRPAAVPLAGGGRVLVLACGTGSSGIPSRWAATPRGPGVARLDEPTDRAADRIAEILERHRRPDDVVVVSVHWGPNWDWSAHPAETRFAHRLVDAGVHVVHGHSSHHPRPVEVYRDRLVLYGCGDLIDDYEGITGHEDYRPDLRLLVLVRVEAGTGALLGLRMLPLQAWRLRLRQACAADTEWLADRLDRISAGLAPPLRTTPSGALVLEG
jgi:poly-gamma-glutamate synthesis protein (capsule biosynthesis protein)